VHAGARDLSTCVQIGSSTDNHPPASW
jgi:hypothetical protein